MKTLRYLKRLIGFNSSSQLSNRDISKYLEAKLTKHGFVIEKVKYRDRNRVVKYNLVAKKGQGRGGLAFCMHSDTVPATRWFTDKCTPFTAAMARERLYGRGACDMKGAIACLLSASQFFTAEQLRRPVYFIVTADEEVGHAGARCVVDESRFYREIVAGGTKAIITEPTSLEVVYAHKGTVRIRAVSEGKAAHSATRGGINANLAMIPFLSEMKALHDETEADPKWHHSHFDPPTVSWNIGINDNNTPVNVTAARSTCTVYFRPMPHMNVDPLLDRVRRAGQQFGLKVEIEKWSAPMFNNPDADFVQQALQLAHRPQAKTVSYATDGGTFTEIENMIVFGPGSIEQAHTIDEWISIEQLSLATELYAKFIRHFCCE
jgi:acetylornithine deacetylase